MLESIEKLRASQYVGQHMTVNEIADAIEQEISERYMPLPVDADGVPIRYGDKLSSDEMPGRAFTCFTCLGFNVTQLNGVPWWTVEWRYDGESGTSEYVSAKSCRHVKPRTIEDVLRDFLNESFKWNAVTGKYEVGNEYNEKKLRRYADVLRDLLGGDAE